MPTSSLDETLREFSLPESLLSDLHEAASGHESAEKLWASLINRAGIHELDFAVQRRLHAWAFSDRDASEGRGPLWIPDEQEIAAAPVQSLMREVEASSFAELHAWSIKERESYWQRTVSALSIVFAEEPRRVCDTSKGVENPDWLCGAKLNISQSCFQGEPSATAIIHQHRDRLEHMSYAELKEQVDRTACGLSNFGITAGNRVAICTPMHVESVIAYLAIVSLGASVVSIADSFSADEIKQRMGIADADAIVTQDFILRGSKEIAHFEKVKSAQAPKAIVLALRDGEPQGLRADDISWQQLLDNAGNHQEHFVDPREWTNILFSSGTTGEPKAIPWDHTTPVKCAADAHWHMNFTKGKVLCWPTNLGWMMGPWLIYAALINRGTIALYADAPTSRGFGEFVRDSGVTHLGVVPSIVQQWKESDCLAGIDWGAIEFFASTGECSREEDMHWLMSLAGYRPVIEYCGGTEIGGAYITNSPVDPVPASTFTTPSLGSSFCILDDEGVEADEGEVFLHPPAIGLSRELVNRDHHEVYHKGVPADKDGQLLRRHGDRILRLKNGHYQAMGRNDDTMNLGGIKVSSAEIEAVLHHVEGVGECAAIAVHDGGPSRLVVYVVPASQAETDNVELQKLMQSQIKTKLNPLFKIQEVVTINKLPRTASNKVMRRVLRDNYMKGEGHG